MMILIGKNYLKTAIPLIDNAKTNIDILMYQWGYYSSPVKCTIQQITLAIKSAIIRGVTVRILIHAGSPADGLRRKNSETMSHLGSWGANVKWYKKSGTMHSKLLLIDKTLAICGSHNYSKKSMSGNIETSVLVEGSGEIRPFLDYFDILWGQN